MIIKEKIEIKPFQCERMLHIYLPDQRAEDERFGVLYMFDGHNLFYDHDATYGKSWGLKDYLDENQSRLIVVGLECNHEGNERLNEFSPYDFTDFDYGKVTGKGIPLIEWMISDLKDWVDTHYPTRPEREYTYVGGSSMGGLMSLYMALKYSRVFSKAISVSPHIYPLYKQMRNDLNSVMVPNTEVYISWGGQEYPDPKILAMATDQNLQIIRALLKKDGVDVIPHVFKNDNHSEAAWQKEMPIWMKELKLGQQSRKMMHDVQIVTMDRKNFKHAILLQSELDDLMMPYLPNSIRRNPDLSMPYWIGMIKQTIGFGLIAMVDDQPVGYLIADKARGSINYLYVKEEYQRQGVGTALVEECKSRMKKLGYSSITLNVLSLNEKAIKFYQRLGFSEYELGLIQEL